MTMYKLCCTAVLSVALAGCTVSRSGEGWSRRDGTAGNLQVDWGLCGGNYIRGKRVVGTGKETQEEWNQLRASIIRCMKDKGYVKAGE